MKQRTPFNHNGHEYYVEIDIPMTYGGSVSVGIISGSKETLLANTDVFYKAWSVLLKKYTKEELGPLFTELSELTSDA